MSYFTDLCNLKKVGKIHVCKLPHAMVLWVMITRLLRWAGTRESDCFPRLGTYRLCGVDMPDNSSYVQRHIWWWGHEQQLSHPGTY